MTCPQCETAVPEESVFCLRCGARVTPPPRLGPSNGGSGSPSRAAGVPESTWSSAPVARGPAPAAPATAEAPAMPPGVKQAYALSFKALSDERLRYRVARWVLEQAPAHSLADIQERLARGDFATFLALTAEGAETARQRIQGLGVHPALWRLAPATTAELLVPELPSRKPPKEEWSPQKKIAAVAIGLLALFLFGALASYRFLSTGPATPPRAPVEVIRGNP
jgi:hypothetical protein